MENSYESIYDYYVRQEDLINGRSWYKNDARSIWWNDKSDNWSLGMTTSKGGTTSYAELDNDGRCLPKIPNQNWKIFHEDTWISAGNSSSFRTLGYRS